MTSRPRKGIVQNARLKILQGCFIIHNYHLNLSLLGDSLHERGDYLARTRKENRSGSVRKLDNGIWECVIQSRYCNPETGNPKRIKRKGKTEAEATKNAQMELKRWEKQIIQGRDTRHNKRKLFSEYMKEFPDIFRAAFGDRFWILTREEVIGQKLFGTGRDHRLLRDMLGDYLAISVSDATIFLTHKEAGLMPGGHAGLTKEEMDIPLLAIIK